ncbi:MAG: hypothetical protein ACXV8X_07405, partial [Candidatus Angelobacter sp.]
MFRKKAPIVPIFLVSILVLVCLIAAQYIPSHNKSAQQVQRQGAPTALREVAMTNSGPAKVQDATRLQVEAS